MESVVRKCLNVREKCFEINSCPIWLLSILPNRTKSVESIIENDNEQQQQSKIDVDLSPFKLNNSIPILNSENLKNSFPENFNFEYPNEISFSNELLNNYSQFIYSPSNEQFIYLFNKLKQLKENKIKILLNKNENKCKQINCSNKTVPLTQFCKIHLIENDSKQILFIKCHHCQQISIKQDNNNILHFCSYLN